MIRALAIYLGAALMAAWAILRAWDHLRGRREDGNTEVVVDVPESLSWLQDEFPDEVAAYRAAVRAEFARWLVVQVGYPFDVIFDEAPPVPPVAVARAWREAPPPCGDATVSEEEWLDTFRLEMGDERFAAWEADTR
jgi:hypothetical protein